LGFIGFLGFLKKPKKPRFFKTQFYSPGRDAKKRRDALHSLKKFTKIFRRLIDRNWEKKRDKKWSSETDMSSRPLGDRPHKHRFTGRSLRGQLNLHQLMHRPHVAVLRDLWRSSVEITRTHTHTLIYHCWAISCFVSAVATWLHDNGECLCVVFLTVNF